MVLEPPRDRSRRDVPKKATFVAAHATEARAVVGDADLRDLPRVGARVVLYEQRSGVRRRSTWIPELDGPICTTSQRVGAVLRVARAEDSSHMAS